MFTLIENGDVYGPEPLGRTSVLLVDSKIQKIGNVDRRAIEKLEVPCEVIDASGCFVTPGLIDPHQHLLGGQAHISRTEARRANRKSNHSGRRGDHRRQVVGSVFTGRLSGRCGHLLQHERQRGVRQPRARDRRTREE